MAKIDAFFKLMHEQGASDLHLMAGQPPALRVRGDIERVKYKELSNDDLRGMLYEIASEQKIKSFEEIVRLRGKLRQSGKRVVFTNGCFDILHVGHIKLLHAAAAYGDRLIIGLNSDSSVKRLKGESRPVVPENERAALLASIRGVDLVVLFDEETPLELIRRLVPDVLVKGGDYRPETVVGRDVVEQAGGEVVIVPLLDGVSTTKMIDRIRTHNH